MHVTETNYNYMKYAIFYSRAWPHLSQYLKSPATFCNHDLKRQATDDTVLRGKIVDQLQLSLQNRYGDTKCGVLQAAKIASFYNWPQVDVNEGIILLIMPNYSFWIVMLVNCHNNICNSFLLLDYLGERRAISISLFMQAIILFMHMTKYNILCRWYTHDKIKYDILMSFQIMVMRMWSVWQRNLVTALM